VADHKLLPPPALLEDAADTTRLRRDWNLQRGRSSPEERPAHDHPPQDEL